jgi:hypothetical protein
MMKRCAKSNCIKNSIIRGKYCEEHRTRKKISIQPVEVIQQPDIQSLTQNNIEQERRFLIDEQNKEYEETMRLDLIRNQEKEQQMLEKVFKESEMDQVRQFIFSNEKTDDSFNIKFSINGKQNIHYFNRDALFRDIFQYIDLYLYDTKTEMEYDLIYYPNIVFSKDEYIKVKLSEYFDCKCLSILVRNKNA